MGSLQTIKVSYKMCTEVGRNDLSGASTELAYKFFLALFPFLIFLAALGGFISKAFGIVNPTDEVMNLIGKHLPNDASSLLRSQVDQVVRTRNSTLASLGILGAVMAASSGVASIMKAMNRVYDVKETRSMAKRYGLAVGLTLLGGAFVICAFILLVAGQLFGSEIADKLNLDSQTELIVSVARWPVAIFLLLIAIAFLFWAAPDIDLPFRWIARALSCLSLSGYQRPSSSVSTWRTLAPMTTPTALSGASSSCWSGFISAASSCLPPPSSTRSSLRRARPESSLPAAVKARHS